MKTDTNKTTRRQWFTAGLRWGAAGLMAAVSWRLMGRKSSQTCLDPKGHIGCRDCSALNGCGLPQALSLKHHLEKNNEKRKS